MTPEAGAMTTESGTLTPAPGALTPEAGRRREGRGGEGWGEERRG